MKQTNKEMVFHVLYQSLWKNIKHIQTDILSEFGTDLREGAVYQAIKTIEKENKYEVLIRHINEEIQYRIREI
ncbi:MAG: hypothetical protein ACTSYF_03605 [Promethearchaeota archaeon]